VRCRSARSKWSKAMRIDRVLCGEFSVREKTW
jgi:hypothetical protein